MKMKNGLGRRLRYGGVTAALTAAIIAIIIIVNVIFSALAGKLLWYTDLTPELLFTLSDNCIDLIKNGDPEFAANGSTSPIQKIDDFRKPIIEKALAEGKTQEEAEKQAKEEMGINIIFCDTDLNWEGDVVQRYVLETARQLRQEFPDHINIKHVDIVRNPTAVTKYSNSISPSSVIIECGSEFRVRAIRSFYVFDDSSADPDTPWAYNGEKIMAAAILAVTRASSPIAGIVSNHGEKYIGDAFTMTLVNAGYDVRSLDFHDEIPADCRLLVINCPQVDFVTGLVAEDGSLIDEVDKLDDFLDKGNSMMVFMDPTLTARLDNFEDYLEEWGVAFDRKELEGGGYEPYRIKDLSKATLNGNGFSFFAEAGGLGMAKEITDRLAGRKVVFPEAMSISYSDLVDATTPYKVDPSTGKRVEIDDVKGELIGYIGSVSDPSSNTSREIYDLFISSENAVAEAGGVQEEVAANGNNFKLMTLTFEDRFIQESNYTTAETPSYVVASGCPGFMSDTSLNGSYGNTMFLEYTLRTLGHEPVPVGLTFKSFGDYTIDTVEVDQAYTYMAVYAAVPLVLAAGVGVFVIVRRRNR